MTRELHVDDLDPLERYKLLNGLVLPRPIAFVSTQSPEGQSNLAPYSFFNAVSATPMALVYCPANHSDGSEKDSLRNAKPIAEGGNGCFVVNLAVDRYIRQVAGAAEDLPQDESEFSLVGLRAQSAVSVNAPRVAEAPAGFECETLQVLRLAGNAPSGGNLVVGRVVHVWVGEQLIDARFRVDAQALKPVGRMGGNAYCHTDHTFEIPRGRAALADKGACV